MMKRLLLVLVFILLSVSLSWAGDAKPRKPDPKDKCPVCGMFIAKYPDYVAQIIFRDGSCVFFDGVKDMMKYYFKLSTYGPSQARNNIAAIYVTDYYKLEPVDGFSATYVSGSDVFGPMGKELIPFEKESEAKEFLKDHKGKTCLRFQDIDEALLGSLD
jgi:copper chaperone NosL